MENSMLAVPFSSIVTVVVGALKSIISHDA